METPVESWQWPFLAGLVEPHSLIWLFFNDVLPQDKAGTNSYPDILGSSSHR
ncbi:MAG: hypothetical protein NTV55_05180 [Planctomycetota bacterium]|nr:hypothetical protein [Planctomycetota bacterium]